MTGVRLKQHISRSNRQQTATRGWAALLNFEVHNLRLIIKNAYSNAKVTDEFDDAADTPPPLHPQIRSPQVPPLMANYLSHRFHPPHTSLLSAWPSKNCSPFATFSSVALTARDHCPPAFYQRAQSRRTSVASAQWSHGRGLESRQCIRKPKKPRWKNGGVDV